MLNEGRGLLLATSGDFSWPPVGTSVGHQRILSHGHGHQDLNEGRVTSKLEGAEWTKAKLDPKWIPLIEYCWNDRKDPDIHISQPAVPEIFGDALAFVKYAVALGKDFVIG